MITFKRVLVVVAHPDDEVLGCGGLIAKLVDEGSSVFVLVMNNGCDFREGWSEEGTRKECGEALSLLADGKPIGWMMCTFKTARFEDTPQRIFNDVVSQRIKDFAPDTVLTHDAYDLHKDHRVVHEAVMVACRFKNGSPVKNVLTFPVISSSDISPRWGFEASFYVDIFDHLYKKIDAMKCYKTEYAEMPNQRGEHAISVWAQFFGLQANMRYAEPFKIIRACM